MPPLRAALNKPPRTLVDRPAHRDWTIWLAGVVVAVAHLWDVVDIYLLDRHIYQVLGPQGSAVTLLAELLLAAMTGTFVVVVLTTTRRTLRNWRYERYLARNVTILTSPARERRTPSPNGAPLPQSGGSEREMREGLPSPSPTPGLIPLRFNDDKSPTSAAVDPGWHGHG
ncbi:MAG: hypothetical protein M3O70_09600 [Actinomycetota bacterium]|nr:hypothetical protein [Actinomycetota bacterium]